MTNHSPDWPTAIFCAKLLARRIAVGTTFVICCYGFAAYAQVRLERDGYLQRTPAAQVKVQAVKASPAQDYTVPNQVMMYQPEQEDPLSLYARTQDGEWLIPAEVDPADPWVRLLMLGPAEPAIVDVAIEINQEPYRAAREHWIDKLLDEAKEKPKADVVSREPEPEEVAEADSTAKSNTETAVVQADEPVEADEVVQADEAAVPMVSAQSRQASSLFKRLINYLAANRSTADREEVRWLIAEWTGGPSLLTLGPAFSWRRAGVAPLWDALDRDGDQILSRHEVQTSAQTLEEADINRDDMVDLTELIRLSKQHATTPRSKGYPMLVVLDDQTDWRALKKHLVSAYGESDPLTSDAKLLARLGADDRSAAAGDLTKLMSMPPDLVYRVVFAKEEASMSLLAVESTEVEDGSGQWRLHSNTEHVITVERPDTYMELTAAQGEIDVENASGDMQQTQVSIGAVVDGYPLFRLLDHDNNRQLTLRERRDLVDLLTSLDSDGDGQLVGSEIPTAIRMTVTHGPQAHRQLAQPVAAQRKRSGPSETTAPAWFVGMDRNRDGDLSKREFQGSPSQFSKFDQDGDDLISIAEVQEKAANN